MGEVVREYQVRRDLLVNGLNSIPGITCQKPQGAFYIFPKAPKGMTASEFCTKAIERNVLIIPGNVFSAADTHFRISYATTDEKIAQGCEILCDLAK